MKNTLTGLILATLLGITAVAIYGTEELLDQAWVAYTASWLIGSGAIVDYLLSYPHIRGWLCQHLDNAKAVCIHLPRA